MTARTSLASGKNTDVRVRHMEIEEVFRGHYAHGTTLRMISGNVITAAQSRWFNKALEGPIWLSEDAEQSLA
ncbi:hypothetical protein [Streptomyces sp. NPDC001250]|uniref:hypothetical protein n=1 Tax=unclassified Streptomyces TaxID=2593676 RepID=UPI0033293BAB